MSKALVDKALEDARNLGIRNILALRGDPPRTEEYEGKKGDKEEFEWAIDLVRYIRRQYGDYFCIGVAAYPEGHADESHPQGQSLEHDLKYLVEKVQAGADFIMTQLFFDIDAYDHFETRLREHPSGAFKNIPIIPGMMPIQGYQMIKRTTKLSHAKLPSNIMERLESVKGDDEMVKKVGVDIVSEMVEHIKTSQLSPKSGKRGFHFYTLNLEKSVAFILERTNLIPLPAEDEIAVLEPVENGVEIQNQGRKSRRSSSVGNNPHNLVIISEPQTSRPDLEATPSEAGIPALLPNSRANTLAISEGEGSLGTYKYPNLNLSSS
jgi:methylenetetrahydrofolate reductase (NADPH)